MKQICWIILCALSLMACMDDDDFLVSPTAEVVLGRSAVDIGVVIANEMTPTDTFKIFNPHDKPLRFSRIWLEQGAASPFRINVDGQMLSGGSAIENAEIAKRDSLIIFYFVKPADFDSDTPVAFSDRLHFLTEGGVEQTVLLQAASQSVILKDGVVVSADETFDATRPYHIKNSLTVAEGATLTIAEGVQMLFDAQSSLDVFGTLVVNGTAENNCVFRGDRLGNMLSDVPYDCIPNQWRGIVITSESYGNVIDFADIHSANVGISLHSADASQLSLTLTNSILHNMAAEGLYAVGSTYRVVNCQITNCGTNCVEQHGGDSRFVHATIAQFYPFVGGKGVALQFSNYDGDTRLPLSQLSLTNCIVTGAHADDIQGERNAQYPDDLFEYSFVNCLLNTPRVDDDEHFRNCLWSEDEASGFANSNNFFPAFDYDKLIFPFTLSKDSRAIGAADYNTTLSEAPFDRLGHPRTLDNRSDIGCYEFTE